MSKRGRSGRVARAGRRARPPRSRDIFVPRPFEGLIDEPEWIALREIVPAATAPLPLRPELAETYHQPQITLATLLPLAWPVMRRPDGEILLAMHRRSGSGDPNRDLAATILAALDTEPGQLVPVPGQPGEGPRLAEVIVDGELDITLHDGFGFWLGAEEADPEVAASLERANNSIYPTVRMAAARAAYWCRVSERAHLRWVLREPEEDALTALARLAAADALKLRPDTKFAGMFRTCGRLVPVWDLPREADAAEWEESLAAVATRYAEALADDRPLDPAGRRARQGLIGRQLNLR